MKAVSDSINKNTCHKNNNEINDKNSNTLSYDSSKKCNNNRSNTCPPLRL